MERRSSGRRVAVLLMLAILVSCQSPTRPTDQSEQEAALSRWNRCLDREAALLGQQIDRVMSDVQKRCEGHQRDVIDTFPPHLHDQLAELLDQRARRRLAGQVQDAAFQSFTTDSR